MRPSLSKLAAAELLSNWNFELKTSVTVSSFAACQKYEGAKDFAGSRCTIGWPVFTQRLILARFWLASDFGSFLARVWLASAAAAVSSCQSQVFCRVIYGREESSAATIYGSRSENHPLPTANFIFWMALKLIGVKLAWKWSKQFLQSSLCFPLKFISVFCQNNGNRVSLTPALTIA